MVKQIENLTLLLEYFAERQRPATLAEIMAHFGWPRSSTYNIINTLAELGYLYEPHTRGGYYPSPKWLDLSQTIADANPVPERLSRIVEKLAASTGETVWVNGRSGLHSVVLKTAESEAAIRYTAAVGKRLPIHVTASGQALMSQMPERDVENILRRVIYTKYEKNSPTSAGEVRKQIADGCKRGWFRSASHYSADLGGVSVPVVDDKRIFSITVAGPLFRVEPHMEDLAREVHAAIAAEYGKDFVTATLKDMRAPA